MSTPPPPDHEPPRQQSAIVQIGEATAEATREAGRQALRVSARLYQFISADIILLLAFLGMLYCLVYFTINSNQARRLMNELVNGRAFRGAITWDRVTWGPWPSTLTIEGARLADSTGQPVITARAIDLDLNLFALADGVIEGDDVTIQSPVVRLREVPAEDEFGRPTRMLNIAAMFLPPQQTPPDGAPTSGPTLRFRVARIDDARYEMDLPAVYVDAKGVGVTDAYFQLEPPPGGAGPMRMQMAAADVRAQDVVVKVAKGPPGPNDKSAGRRALADTLRWQVKRVEVDQYAWRDDTFRVERLKGRMGQDTLSVRGFELGLTGPGAPRIGGALEVDSKDIGPHLAQFGLTGFRGPAKVRGQSNGELLSQAGALEASGEALTLPSGVVLPRWSLRTHHRDNRLDVDEARIDWPEATVTATGFLDGEPGTFGADVTLDGLRPRVIEGLELPESAALLSGARISGRVRLRGRDAFDATAPQWGEVEVRLTDPEDRRLPDDLYVELSALRVGTRLEVTHLDFRSEADQLVGQGAFDTATRDASLDISGHVESVGAWWPMVARGPGPERGAVDISARLSGPLRDLDRIGGASRAAVDGTLALKVRDLAFDGLPLLSADVRAQVRAGRVAVTSLDATAGQTTLSGNAEVGLTRSDPTLRGGLSIGQLDLAAWPTGLPLRGQVEATLTLDGTLAAPSASGRFGARALGFADYPEATLDAQARWRGLKDGTLEVTSAMLTSAAGGARVEGALSFGARPSVEATADVEGLDLSSLPPLSALNLGGRLSGRVQASGPLSGPRVAARVRVDDARWRSLSLAQVSLDGALTPSLLQVSRLEAKLDDAAGLQVQDATLALDGSWAFAGGVKGDALPLNLANHFTDAAIPIRGSVSFDATGRGTPADPSLRGSLSLVEAGFGKWPVGGAKLTFAAGEQRVRVDGQLLRGSALSLSVPTAPGLGPATGEVRFTDLTLDDYLTAALPPSDRPLHARVTGRVGVLWDLHATPRPDPEVEVDFSDLRAQMPPVDLVNVSPLRAQFVKGGLTVRDFALLVSGQPLRIDVTTRPDGALDGRLEGELDLATLEPVLASTFSSVQGRASLTLQVGGTLTEPLPEGRAVLHSAWLVPRSPIVGGELALTQPAELRIAGSMRPTLGPEPSDARGRFVVFLPPSTEAQPQNRLRLRRDDGTVTVREIEVEFAGFLPDEVRLGLDASNATLNLPDVLRATFNATGVRFALSGLGDLARARMFLGGEIDVQRAVYSAPILSTSALNQGLRDNFSGVARTRSVSLFERVPLLKNFAVDLSLRGENDVFVRNEIAVLSLDLEVRPDVRVRGNLYDRPDLRPDERLRITGEVSTLPDTSKILYAGREFDVRSGQVDFGRDSFMDATVVAQRTFQLSQDPAATATTTGIDAPVGASQSDITATLEFRFKLPDLDASPQYSLELSSDSNVSNIDVASLVLTGQLASQVSGQTSAQPALELALSGVITRIEAPLEQTFDIDLSLVPQTTGTLFVSADKSLSRRLRLYSRTPVGENEDGLKRIFGLEYQLNNFAFGDLSNESLGLSNSTTGRLKLRLDLD